jgi:hypothetical protein
MVEKNSKKGHFIACLNKECKYQELTKEEKGAVASSS